MTTGIPERLYELLPAHIRNRDAGSGQHLRALLAIIDAERQRIEQDIHQLYDDQFIETCDPWVVAYIADLLDINLPSTETNQRAYVANTIGYRRRKGVIGTLEDLAGSITGWPTVAVEFFKHLARTQHVDHPRPSRTGFARVRDASRMAKNSSAFEEAPRGAEVRLVDTARGKFGVSNIGLFAWRTTDAPLSGVEPRRVEGGGPSGDGFERYHLHPVGVDLALVNRTRHREEQGNRVGERDVPARLRNRRLFTELEAIKDGEVVDREFFGPGEDPVTIYVDDEAVPHAQLSICNLETWDEPTFDGDAPRPQAVVDVERGRLLIFDDTTSVDDVRADYAYGMLAEVGGGPYERRDSLERWSANTGDLGYAALVSEDPDDAGEGVYSTLHEAIDAWNTQVASSADGLFGIIAISGSGTHEVPSGADRLECRVPPECRLVVVAGDWPTPEETTVSRKVENLRVADDRPHVLGDIRVDATGGGAADIEDRGIFVVDGVLVEGAVTVTGALGAMGVFHSTLVPERGGVGFDTTEGETGEDGPEDGEEDDVGDDGSGEDDSADPAGELAFFDAYRSVLGPLHLAGAGVSARIVDSVIDGDGGPAIAGPEAEVTIRRTTVFGSVELERLEADDSIFEDMVDVDRRQDGCVRYCYAPPGSRLPRTYRCMPHEYLDERRRELDRDLTDAEIDAIDAQIRPTYVSREWWRAGFAQLDDATSVDVRTGAEDGSEMGVHAHLKVPQKLANLSAALDEHLRVGMFAGIFFEP